MLRTPHPAGAPPPNSHHVNCDHAPIAVSNDVYPLGLAPSHNILPHVLPMLPGAGVALGGAKVNKPYRIAGNFGEVVNYQYKICSNW